MFKEPSHSVNSFKKGRSKPQYTVEQKKAYAKKMQKQREGTGSSKRIVKDIECFKCGQMGHYKRECPNAEEEEHKIKGDKKRKRDKAPAPPTDKKKKKKKKGIKDFHKKNDPNSHKIRSWQHKAVMKKPKVVNEDEEEEEKEGDDSGDETDMIG
jgi:hypothetical protein